MTLNKYSTGIWTTLFVFLAYQLYHGLYDIPPVPDLAKDEWWGLGSPPKSPDTSIRPFKVQFKPERIAQLKTRLSDVSWLPEPLDGVGFRYGFNSKYLKEVVTFWKNSYNFAEREKSLNKFPQFKTNIQGLDIHYVHITQPNPKKLRVVPLMVIYCWPINNHRLLDELLKPREGFNFVFSIVAPSLPGFGYSQSASRPGLGIAQTAVILDNLMGRLGHSNYFVHGGDWGAEVGAIMSVLYPKAISGLHTNLPTVTTPVSVLKHLIFSIFPGILVESKLIPKLYPLSTYYSNILEESGHIHLQATKPDTFGISLQDSPVGLAAHLLDKFSSGTNKAWKPLADGGLTKKFSLTDLLDNVMVYWDSGSITTSMRIYSETFNKTHIATELERIPITVPTIAIRSGNDLVFFSSCQLRERFYNLVRVTDIEDAGHFAGLEIPDVVAEDVWKSIEEMEKS